METVENAATDLSVATQIGFKKVYTHILEKRDAEWQSRLTAVETRLQEAERLVAQLLTDMEELDPPMHPSNDWEVDWEVDMTDARSFLDTKRQKEDKMTAAEAQLKEAERLLMECTLCLEKKYDNRSPLLADARTFLAGRKSETLGTEEKTE